MSKLTYLNSPVDETTNEFIEEMKRRKFYLYSVDVDEVKELAVKSLADQPIGLIEALCGEGMITRYRDTKQQLYFDLTQGQRAAVACTDSQVLVILTDETIEQLDKVVVVIRQWLKGRETATGMVEILGYTPMPCDHLEILISEALRPATEKLFLLRHDKDQPQFARNFSEFVDLLNQYARDWNLGNHESIFFHTALDAMLSKPIVRTTWGRGGAEQRLVQRCLMNAFSSGVGTVSSNTKHKRVDESVINQVINSIRFTNREHGEVY